MSLIMWIAVKKESYEIRTAKRILDRDGTEYMKYHCSTGNRYRQTNLYLYENIIFFLK
jgi:hypothetical protein